MVGKVGGERKMASLVFACPRRTKAKKLFRALVHEMDTENVYPIFTGRHNQVKEAELDKGVLWRMRL